MSETNWGETEAPVRKKRVPTWLWFCGGGCLLAVVFAIALLGFGVKFVKDATNPEKQWPAVAEILPFDQRPPELHLIAGNTLGADFFVFQDDRGFVVVLMRLRSGDPGEARRRVMDPNQQGGFMSAGARRDMVAGQVHVQGRDLDVLRFHQESPGEKSGEDKGEEAAGHSGPSIWVDVTPAGSEYPVLLQLTRVRSDEPIRDEDVQAFLKPFHVGPDR
jgi:hypothetical protein